MWASKVQLFLPNLVKISANSNKKITNKEVFQYRVKGFRGVLKPPEVLFLATKSIQNPKLIQTNPVSSQGANEVKHSKISSIKLSKPLKKSKYKYQSRIKISSV